MNDLESTYFLVSSDLARRRAMALHRARLSWAPQLEDAPAHIDACCESGDYDDAA